MLANVARSPWLTPLRNLVYPPTCLLCDRFLGLSAAGVVCPICRAGLPLRTAEPVHSADGLDGIFFLYSYGRAARKLVHRIKMTQDPRAGVWLRSELARLRAAQTADFDAVIPVPSHRRSSIFGTPGTTTLWAQELADAFGIPLRNALRRTRTVPKQTSLTRIRRLAASEDSLSVRMTLLADCRSVLLADDVMTTGATARACARALKACGVQRVSLAAVARG